MISLSIRDQTVSVLAKLGGIQLTVHSVVLICLLQRKNLGANISWQTYNQRCNVIYISAYLATVHCFTLHVLDGTGMMKQSVLCLNVIDQHYLYLPAEGDTVTFTFDTLFISS